MARSLGLLTATVAAALSLSCLGISAEPTPAPSPATPPPPLQAGPIADWDGAEVKSICLTVDDDYGLAARVSLTPEVWLRSMIEPVGLAIVDSGCTAQFDLAITIHPESGAYWTGTYFTGGSRELTASLSKAGKRTLVYHSEASHEPPSVIVDDGHLATTATEYVNKLDWWVAGHLLQAVSRMWGYAPAVEGVKTADWPQNDGAGLMPIEILGVAAAGTGPNELDDAYPAWRSWLEEQPVATARPEPSLTSRDEPVPLGDAALTPDGWSIRITDVALGDGPDGGARVRRVTVEIEATWFGYGWVDPTLDDGPLGTFSPTADPSWCPIPEPGVLSDVDATRGMYAGEPTRGWAACWLLSRKDAQDMVASYEPIASSIYDPIDGDADAVWFALD